MYSLRVGRRSRDGGPVEELDVARAVRRSGWRKSRLSGDVNACVEVAMDDGYVGVRDSRAPAVGLRVSRSAWRAFVASVKLGELRRQDDPGRPAGELTTS